MRVEVVNTEQAAAWDGHEGDVWTEQADRYDRASRRIWQRFVDGDLVGRADRVLDMGCGTGGPTRHVARLAPEGEVMGIDLSTRMLELARARSADEGLDNVSFVRGDAQVFPFEPDVFDIAMSSFRTMFFNDPVAAYTNIGGGLRPSGTIAWTTKIDGGMSQVVLSGNLLFVTSYSNMGRAGRSGAIDQTPRLIALSPTSGSMQWQLELDGFAAVVDPYAGGVYVTTMKRDGLNSGDGMVNGSMGTGSMKRSVAAVDYAGKILWKLNLD